MRYLELSQMAPLSLGLRLLGRRAHLEAEPRQHPEESSRPQQCLTEQAGVWNTPLSQEVFFKIFKCHVIVHKPHQCIIDRKEMYGELLPLILSAALKPAEHEFLFWCSNRGRGHRKNPSHCIPLWGKFTHFPFCGANKHCCSLDYLGLCR